MIALLALSGVAAAAPAKDAGAVETPRQPSVQRSHVTECSPSHHSNTGHGANTDGPGNPYHNTCETEHAPGNGNGAGNASGKPCAGCVGNADDKNPPGQAPGGSDHNAGYECDRNQGVGKENPAHTGCRSSSTPPPDGGDDGDGGTNPPVCPAGAAAMIGHEFELDGVQGDLDDVQPTDDVKATFTIAAGCKGIVVSLASYGADRKLFDSDSGTFGPGQHTLAVDTPDCVTEVDFVFGGVVPTLGAAEGSPYSNQGRLIDAGSGSKSCPPSNPGGQDGTPQDNPDTPNTPPQHGGNGSSPTDSEGGTALVPAVTVTAGTSTPAPAEVLAGTVARGGGTQAPGDAMTRGRPADVLGVQIQRPDPASPLARTGLGALTLVMVGGLFSLVGLALASTRDRRETVSVAARLAGYGVAA